MNQNLTLLAFLAKGRSVTRLEAHVTLRIQNITARIVELRDAGWNIVTETKRDANGALYADYSMHPSDRDQAAFSVAHRQTKKPLLVAHKPLPVLPQPPSKPKVMSFAEMTA